MWMVSTPATSYHFKHFDFWIVALQCRIKCCLGRRNMKEWPQLKYICRCRVILKTPRSEIQYGRRPLLCWHAPSGWPLRNHHHSSTALCTLVWRCDIADNSEASHQLLYHRVVHTNIRSHCCTSCAACSRWKKMPSRRNCHVECCDIRITGAKCNPGIRRSGDRTRASRVARSVEKICQVPRLDIGSYKQCREDCGTTSDLSLLSSSAWKMCKLNSSIHTTA